VYLRKLRVKNIKLLRDVELDFTRDGGPRLWTVFIGENGLCKTALLQAIALAASGPDRANQLADVPSLRDARHPDELAVIEAEFGFGDRGHEVREYPGVASRPAKPPRLISRLWIDQGKSTFQGVSSYLDAPGADPDKDPLREARARCLRGWFVAGYGAVRPLPKTIRPISTKDSISGRLDTLFEKGELVALGFITLFPKETAMRYAVATTAIFDAGKLLPKPNRLMVFVPGIKDDDEITSISQIANLASSLGFKINQAFSEKNQIFLGADHASQGKRSTIAWLSDVVGHQFVESSNPESILKPKPGSSEFDFSDFEGLVLVDELDVHLHPSWQVSLVPGLKKALPNIQFIGTTHSPMILPNLERDEVICLQQNETGDVRAVSLNVSPALMTGSEIYETFFGIDRLYPNELGEALQRYGLLAGNPTRSDEEDAELTELRAKLREHDVDPGWEPVPRQGAS
jgi:predicted ATPase